jgi:hypothetical protein
MLSILHQWSHRDENRKPTTLDEDAVPSGMKELGARINRLKG